MIIVALIVFGIIFGSFVNALVWRLHEQAELTEVQTLTDKKKKKSNPKLSSLSSSDLSITKGRSMCPHCHHTLAAKDLVPVLSWLSLGGKCRYCRAPISWQYPIVELLTGLLFAVSYLAWPSSLHEVGLFQFGLWLVFVVGFVALAVYDLHWFMLPDRLVAPLTVLAVVQIVVSAVWLHSWSALLQPLGAAAIIFGLFWLLYQVSQGAWIGGGDVKVAITLGLLAATPVHAFLVIFLASLLGTLASVPLLLQGKHGLKLHIPFGPYLLVASAIVVLWGSQMVSWYQNLLV